MSQTASRTASRAGQHGTSGPDRRPAIWPWVVMPAVALAMFVTLHTVRHNGVAGQAGSQARATSATSAR